MAKFFVRDYQKEALSALLPPDDLTVSQFAEKFRVLDAKSAIPGSWRNRITPYLVDIMDEINNPDTEEIVFVKPTQVGGTEALFNMLLYIAAQDPSDALIVYPTDKLVKKTVKNRVRPMLLSAAAAGVRCRAKGSTIFELQTDTMTIYFAGANSPSDLASTPIRFLFLDEVDKYPANSKKEADPIRLARERTKTYHNSKIYITSTPTTEGGHVWQAMLSADVIKHFFVPCPHCGDMFELQLSHIRWPSKQEVPSAADRADAAHYVCPQCGCIIEDAHKPFMLQNGEWRDITRRTDNARRVAYWLNTLYSPFVRWSQIAKEWLDCQNAPELLQNFVNSWLAEPWKEELKKTDADLVLQRQTEYEAGVLPDWAKLLTGGVDVQRDCLYWTVRAWGEGKTSQNVAHGRVLTFAELVPIMNAPFFDQNGRQLLVSLCAVDSGDQTDIVYDFCRENAEWTVPVKGANRPLNYSFYRVSHINRPDSRANGTPLILVDGNRCKDFIFTRMQKDPGDGCWMVHAACDKEYARQITSEHKVVERRNGQALGVWQPKTAHADNHWLDCEVYAFVAAELCHVGDIADTVEDNTDTAAENTQSKKWLAAADKWL